MRVRANEDLNKTFFPTFQLPPQHPLNKDPNSTSVCNIHLYLRKKKDYSILTFTKTARKSRERSKYCKIPKRCVRAVVIFSLFFFYPAVENIRTSSSAGPLASLAPSKQTIKTKYADTEKKKIIVKHEI